jgi:hypothetical protein
VKNKSQCNKVRNVEIAGIPAIFPNFRPEFIEIINFQKFLPFQCLSTFIKLSVLLDINLKKICLKKNLKIQNKAEMTEKDNLKEFWRKIREKLQIKALSMVRTSTLLDVYIIETFRRLVYKTIA